MLIIRESSKHDETYTFLVRKGKKKKEKKNQPMVTWLITPSRDGCVHKYRLFTCAVSAGLSFHPSSFCCFSNRQSPLSSRCFLSMFSIIDLEEWGGGTLSSFFRELGELPTPSPAPPCCRLKRPTCRAFIVPYNIRP